MLTRIIKRGNNIVGGEYLCLNPMQSAPAPELDDLPAVAFRRSARRDRFKLPRCFALRHNLQTQVAARLRFAVERLRNSSRAADLAEQQDLDLKIAAVVGHAQ